MNKCKSLIGGGGGCDDNPSIWAMIGATPQGFEQLKEFLTKDIPSRYQLHDTPTIREYKIIEIHFAAADADIISDELNTFINWDYVIQRTPKWIKRVIDFCIKKSGIIKPLQYRQGKSPLKKIEHKCNSVIFVPFGYNGEQIGDDFFL